MKRKWIYTFITILIVLTSGFIAYADNTVGFYPPQPKDVTVLISKPTISMQFILNNNKIKNIDMQINNKKVDAKFDDTLQTIYFIPEEPLKFGTYKVNLSVYIEGWTKPIQQNWQFTVSDKAIEELSPATNDQKQALAYANIYRKLLDLKELRINDSLNTAAAAHSNYMALNKNTTHDEFANKNGFTGITPYNRAAAFGYTGGYVSENISSGQKEYKEAIDGLFQAPYHRLMWINPFLTDFGYGSKEKYHTFDLGGKKAGEDQVVVYPIHNQTNIPVSWDGNETPNPLRIHGKEGTVGYPITLSYFSEKNITSFTVEKANLTDGKGSMVKTLINTPAKDKQLTDSILIIPEESLKKGEKYTVSVKGKIVFQDKTTYTLDKTWSFTTAAADDNQNSWMNLYLCEDIEGHWAQDIVSELLKKQIVSLKTDKLYKPDDKITRGEFAEFVVKALGLKINVYEGSFKDVSYNTSKAVFIESAYREGIIKGVGSGYFMPYKLVTREEMAVMIIKAYEKKKGTAALQSMPSLAFEDKKEISDWAANAVRSSSYLGIIKGRGNNQFVPKASATRAEAAVMIKKLLETF